jgi:hypothetical protein
MKEERIVLLGSLGYFTTQHLYLNFAGIINCYALYAMQEPEEIDEAAMLISSKELLNIAISSKNQTTLMLSDLPGLHKDDLLFFQKISSGYMILIQLAETLDRFLNANFNNGDEDDIESDFIELQEKAQSEIGSIVGYIN